MGFSLQRFMDDLMLIRNSGDLYNTQELFEMYEEVIYEARRYASECGHIREVK
jgi:hypothetical protein